MKVIIAGSRDITDSSGLYNTLEELFQHPYVSGVVSGGARGPDSIGEKWAKQEGIPVTRFIPDWKRYKNSAGYIRNEEMAKYADCLVAFWDGASAGTRHMINLALDYKLDTHVYIWHKKGPA